MNAPVKWGLVSLVVTIAIAAGLRWYFDPERRYAQGAEEFLAKLENAVNTQDADGVNNLLSESLAEEGLVVFALRRDLPGVEASNISRNMRFEKGGFTAFVSHLMQKYPQGSIIFDRVTAEQSDNTQPVIIGFTGVAYSEVSEMPRRLPIKAAFDCKAEVVYDAGVNNYTPKRWHETSCNVAVSTAFGLRNHKP